MVHGGQEPAAVSANLPADPGLMLYDASTGRPQKEGDGAGQCGGDGGVKGQYMA